MASTLTAPTPITIPFAESGSKNTIPTTSQIGVVDGKSSWPDGFVPLNGTPLVSGGKPPTRADMNGVLYALSLNLRYLLGGCIPKFNATLASAVGGYPVGAIVQDDSGGNCYRNLVDGNSTNFNTTPASIGVSWELVYGPGKTIQSASTTAQGIVELATLAEAIAASDTARAVTPAGLASFLAEALLQATTTVQGKVELATATETIAGTDAERAVTPAGMLSVFTTGRSNNVQPFPGGYKIQAFEVGHAALGNNDTVSFTFPASFTTVCFPFLSSNSTLTGEIDATSSSTEGAEITSYTLSGGVITSYWKSRGAGSFRILAVGR